jgi:hypothetical protein
MLEKEFIRLRNGQARGRLSLSVSGNPLWPLEELRNLRNPPFVADPEFAPVVIGALGFGADLSAPAGNCRRGK